MRVFRWALLLTALAVSMAALAQDQGPAGGQPGGWSGGQGRGPQMNVDNRVKSLTKALNLSDDQQTKVRAALQNEQDQRKQVFQDQSLSQGDRRAKMMDLRQSTNAKIRDVLNDDQKKQFDELLQKQQQRMQQRRGGGGQQSGPPGPPQ